MAENTEEIWTGDIDINTDWGGDENTGNLPVSGGSIQRFIRSQFQENQSSIGNLQNQVQQEQNTVSTLQTQLQQSQTLISDLQTQLLSRPSVVILTQSEWTAIKGAGNVDSNTIYGIIEDEETPEPSGDQEISVDGDILTMIGAAVNEDTLSLIGQYNPETEELILINN